MSTPFDQPDSGNCCSPGDITVTKVPSGYLIGRAMPQLGTGPWWEFICTVSTFTEAAQKAQKLAELGRTKAWVNKGAEDYEPLPPI